MPAPGEGRRSIQGEGHVEAVVNQLNAIIWSQWLIYLCLGLGLYFSIRTRFMQVRGVPEMIRLMLTNKSSAAGVSSFQALAMSLSGRVGIGNIAGVATAIAFGGPGAVFWMWVMAFLGAGNKTRTLTGFGHSAINPRAGTRQALPPTCGVSASSFSNSWPTASGERVYLASST